jgi:hypothetical protein
MLTYGQYLEETSRSDQAAYDAALIGSTELAGAVRASFESMRRHRDTSGVTGRMIHCLRAVNGEYSPQQLADIRKFGGSEAFARITAVKTRTAAALLSDIFLGVDRPWAIEPTPNPTLPEDIHGAIKKLALAEATSAQAAGGPPPDAEAVKNRMTMLLGMATSAAQNQAAEQAKYATAALDDVLVEGGFYSALGDFLIYFTQLPISILKGPFFKSHRRVKYVNKIPQVIEEPMMHFSAPHPMDVWFGVGVSRADEGDVIERIRLSRFDVEALRLTPSYDADAIDAILSEMPTGHAETTSGYDQARADMEEKESPILNDEGLYDLLEFHGWMDGQTIDNEPLFDDYDLDPGRAHSVVVRMIGPYVISAHPNPDPLERSIYDTAAFEKVAGSIYGRALPEILEDMQGLGNNALRAINNNMGLASGPQVGINLSAIGENENSQEMYPWKRWYYASDPAAPTAPPLMFFQPNDNSQNLIAVFEKAMTYADEMSAIPRYASGGERVGGAGRTASGLAMLMGNVAKVFGYTAGGIDKSVLDPKLQYLYTMKLLSDDTGMFRGDETIRARGAIFAAKSEVERTRALEFLQLTANPIDMGIIGPQGRALVLSEVAEHLGFDHNQLALAIRAQAQAPQTPPGAGEEGQGPPGQQPSSGGMDGPPRVAEGIDNQQRTGGGALPTP